MSRWYWRHPEPAQGDSGPPRGTQGPQEWRYVVTLTAVNDPYREVDRALRVWFGDIVKEIEPC
jgi:hypothetical protein